MSALESPEAASAARQRTVALLTAVGFALVWHLWVGDAHLNEAEEGYLWYGTWRTGLGELPLRDFQSYDPGRYLACAALGKVLGSGLLGLRRSIAVFQGIGLAFGLLAARRAFRPAWPLVPIGVVLGLWLFPRQKVFEGVSALALTWVGVRVLEHPSRGRHLVAGVGAGLAAFFGRNHGLYALLGLSILMTVSALRRHDAQWLRKGACLAAGVVLGYSPMLVLFLVPGFWGGFVHSMQLLLRLGANIESPWLWPWQVSVTGLTPVEALASYALAVMYLLPLVVLPIGILCFLRAPAASLSRRALFFAASVLGVLYLHHASVRSDASHLAQSLQPTLLAAVGLVALLSERRRRVGIACATGLASCALLAGFKFNPALNHVGEVELVATQLGGETLRLRPKHAEYFTRLQRTLGALIGPDDTVFFAPSRPAFYPLFQKRSPCWWIYFFVPEADRAEQEGIVEDLAQVDWILIVDQPIAEREDLRFRNTYPLVWTHIQASFQRVPTPELEANHLLYRRRVE